MWVHDFHLLPLAEELRRQRMRQRIGFFLHTPFPPTEILSTLPVHESLTRALFAYDLIGFQTEDDLARFRDHVVRACGGRSRGDKVSAFGREIRVGAFPIGIDVDQFKRYAFTAPGNKEYARMRQVLRGRDQFIGVDRLDYSKGLLRRMDAFGRYLESHPRAHGKVILLQVAPVSRGSIESYRNFRQELDREAARVNGRFARFDWTPVHYLNRALPRRTLAGFYRASRVGIVTPMRDGMNLVAMEYVAAQDAANPGVLVLSRFAGAAQYLREALLVNPYDGEETAEAMHLAREMSLQERRRRHEALMRRLEAHDVDRWRRDFVERARRCARLAQGNPEESHDSRLRCRRNAHSPCAGRTYAGRLAARPGRGSADECRCRGHRHGLPAPRGKRARAGSGLRRRGRRLARRQHPAHECRRAVVARRARARRGRRRASCS